MKTTPVAISIPAYIIRRCKITSCDNVLIFHGYRILIDSFWEKCAQGVISIVSKKTLITLNEVRHTAQNHCSDSPLRGFYSCLEFLG